MDKGQAHMLDRFIQAVKSGERMPIELDSLLDTTALTLGALESIRTGSRVELSSHWTTNREDSAGAGLATERRERHS